MADEAEHCVLVVLLDDENELDGCEYPPRVPARSSAHVPLVEKTVESHDMWTHLVRGS
jgi:hypothetical protein